jgi:anti-sigma regulatory factor (Ser/Thr protein kinase)
MGADVEQSQPADATTALHSLVRASREVAVEPDPAQGLWKLVCALREDLSIDRAGVFFYNHHEQTLDRIAGVNPDGEPEFAGQVFPLEGELHPLRQVARREIRYYLSDDAQRDYPYCRFQIGVRAHAIIPIIAGDGFLGALCVDNCISGKPIPEGLLEPLFLYADLAALPLFALYQKKERERVEAMRWDLLRDVFYSVTNGKIRLCDPEEIQAEWPPLEHEVSLDRPEHVRVLRLAVEDAGREAGMAEDRAKDLGLCASEAGTNALLHGSGGAAAVEHREGLVRVRVEDHGTGITAEDLPRAALLKGWSKRSSLGLGFIVLKDTADRIYLCTGPAGTTLIVEMAVEPKTPEADCPLTWGSTLTL